MTTVDENGWLPLHQALKDNAPLGSIKLLLKGNPAALQRTDRKGLLPVHIACEFSSAKVVRFLVEISSGDVLDKRGTNEDTLLHYSCRSANLEVIECLVSERSDPSVSEVNADNKLPVHLLLENENVAGKSKVYRSMLAFIPSLP